MNKRQRKKTAKRLGLPFEEKPRSRHRRAEAARPAEAPGRPPVRPSRSRRAALEAAASTQSKRGRKAARPKQPAATDPTVAAAPSLTAAVVGLAKATGDLATEVVKQTLTAAEEAVEGAVDKVPVVGAPIARELHHLTRNEDKPPPTRADDEEPLT